MSKTGKFPYDLIEKLIYPKLGAERAEVLIGPGQGTRQRNNQLKRRSSVNSNR